MRTVMPINRCRHGSVLVFTLWTLSLLGMLAVYVSVGVRQKIIFARHMETTQKLRLNAVSVINLAVAVLNQDLKAHDTGYTASGKAVRHNNPKQFKGISLEEGYGEVSYWSPDIFAKQSKKQFGFVDEESKININTAETYQLENLLALVLDKDAEAIQNMALAIIGWREAENVEMKGFYSDDYYQNLKQPYERKHAFYESLDELKLVEGIGPQEYDKLQPFLTVYGDGAVNLNTVSPTVLFAFGLSEEAVTHITRLRRGADGLEATGDDAIFQNPDEILSGLKQAGASDEDVDRMRLLTEQGRFKVNSRFYRLRAEGLNAQRDLSKTIECVFDAAEGKMVYWREERIRQLAGR